MARPAAKQPLAPGETEEECPVSSGSRWRKFPTIAAWAVAPVLFVQVFYHLRGQGDAPLACWVPAALPPLTATAAGVFAFRPARARRVAVSFLVSVLAYLLAAGILALLLALPMISLGPSIALALLAGGAVVGSQMAAAIYRLLRGRPRHPDVGGQRRVNSRETQSPGRGTRAERGVWWLGALAGTIGIVSVFWFSNLLDVMLAMLCTS